jgi:hypothetical protein
MEEVLHGLIIFSSNSAAYWAVVDVWSTRVAAFALYGVDFGIEFLQSGYRVILPCANGVDGLRCCIFFGCLAILLRAIYIVFSNKQQLIRCRHIDMPTMHHPTKRVWPHHVAPRAKA